MSVDLLFVLLAVFIPQVTFSKGNYGNLEIMPWGETKIVDNWAFLYLNIDSEGKTVKFKQSLTMILQVTNHGLWKHWTKNASLEQIWLLTL